MAVQFAHFHPAKSADKLNEEFLLLENPGPSEFVAKGSAITIAKPGQTRPRPLGVIDPGFVLRPGEKVRLIVGNPAKKTHGAAPEEKDGVRNYYLFLSEPILVQTGLTIRLMLNQLEVARATFDAKAKDGLAKASPGHNR